MIPPPTQRSMSLRAGSTVGEVPGSHAVYVSQPEEVAVDRDPRTLKDVFQQVGQPKPS